MFDKLGLRKKNSRLIDLCGHTYFNVISSGEIKLLSPVSSSRFQN